MSSKELITAKQLIAAKQQKEIVSEKMKHINFDEPGASRYRKFLLKGLYTCLEHQLDTIEETILCLETPVYTWGEDDELP